MALADDLATPPTIRRRSNICMVTRVLDALETADPDGATALRAVLTDDRYTSVHLARTMADNGYPISLNSLQRHRRQDCQCPT